MLFGSDLLVVWGVDDNCREVGELAEFRVITFRLVSVELEFSNSASGVVRRYETHISESP